MQTRKNCTYRSKHESKNVDLMIEERSQLKNYEIAKKHGVSLSWMIKEFKKRNVPVHKAGRPEVGFWNEKVEIGGYVKRRFASEAQLEIDKIINKYR